jgi:hypothetical protein
LAASPLDPALYADFPVVSGRKPLFINPDFMAASLQIGFDLSSKPNIFIPAIAQKNPTLHGAALCQTCEMAE